MTAPVKPAPKTRPIYYRPIERHWYRLLDYVQGTWNRVIENVWGRRLIVFSVKFLWIVLRMAVMLAGLVFIIGGGILYVFLSTCLGGGALNKASRRAR